MRIKSLDVREAPPVRRFAVSGLADLVVVAGPNGVGKTRLMERLIQTLRGDQAVSSSDVVVEATTRDEWESWGKREVNLANSQDLQKYRATLHTNKRRRYWRSSVLQFESDRSIQKLNTLKFQWDLPDPTKEEIGWDFGFNSWKNRWQDTIHSIFKMIEHQKQSIATRAMQLRREGHDSMNLGFDDPMLPFKEVFEQLLAPKELVDPAARRQNLEYRLDGQVLNFSSLSSGEREVVNIAFDYLLRQPSDCMVFFDEPELHLHPELSQRLIKTLQGIGNRNQLILTTHSPDIISGALDESVVFISPPTSTDNDELQNQAVEVSEGDETNKALRLLGHSVGIIALGRNIILVEGEQSSLDKETYATLVRESHPEFVLVSSGGKHTITSFESLHSSVLSKSLWGVEFFMLCDRDSAPLGVPTERLRTLPRYHLENYYLDEHTWAAAFEHLEHDGSWLLDPAEIRRVMREIAADFVPYATALHVAATVRRQAGNIDVMLQGVHGTTPDQVLDQLREKIRSERSRVESVLDTEEITSEAARYVEDLQSSIDQDDNGWLVNIPGKPVFGVFANRTGIHPGRLRNMYLRTALEAGDAGPFAEVKSIFDDFSALAQ